MRPIVLALASVALVGCGAPSAVAKQEEALEAIAAEGALLARDAAEGASTAPFTRVHAEALRKEAEALPLAEDADEVAARLGQLADAPDDRALAREVAAALEDAAG